MTFKHVCTVGELYSHVVQRGWERGRATPTPGKNCCPLKQQLHLKMSSNPYKISVHPIKVDNRLLLFQKQQELIDKVTSFCIMWHLHGGKFLESGVESSTRDQEYLHFLSSPAPPNLLKCDYKMFYSNFKFSLTRRFYTL